MELEPAYLDVTIKRFEKLTGEQAVHVETGCTFVELERERAGEALSIDDSRARLEAENLVLRQQINILIRRLPERVRLTNSDRLRSVWLSRLFPSILNAIRVIRPETLIRWYRRGFRSYWRWKFRPRVGRPQLDGELRDLIRQMFLRRNHRWKTPTFTRHAAL